jgi:hypothetical protein
LPTIATALVPQGTQLRYQQYQDVVNSRVLGDALEKQATAAAAGGRINAASAQTEIGAVCVSIAAILYGVGIMGWRI